MFWFSGGEWCPSACVWWKSTCTFVENSFNWRSGQHKRERVSFILFLPTQFEGNRFARCCCSKFLSVTCKKNPAVFKFLRRTGGGLYTHRFFLVLICLLICLCQGIQVTATTPSSTAVRLDTGVMALEVSNSAPTSNHLSGQLRRSMCSNSDYDWEGFFLCLSNPSPRNHIWPITTNPTT